MPLIPYQLPNPRELTPYTEDIEAHKELGSPYTSKAAGDWITNLGLTHQLEQQNYNDQMASQHDYANRVLDAQRSDLALDAIPKFLAQPHGYNVMMGSPDIRRVLSQLSPEMAGAIGQQSFVGDQADIIKKLGDSMKAFTDAGGELDLKKFSDLAGLTINQGVPLPLQVEQAKARSAEEVARIGAGKLTVPEYQLRGPPGTGGTVTFKALPGETFEQTMERAKGLGLSYDPPKSLPPRPGAPAAKPVVQGKTSLSPAKQDEGPLTGAPFTEEQIAKIDPGAWDTAWRQMKSANADKKVDPQKYDNVERLTALRGGKPAVDKSGRIWGMDKSGKYTQYGADEL